MTYKVLSKTLLVVCLSTALCVSVNSSRADLGTYLNVNDFSNGLPASEERITVDSYVLAFINYTYRAQSGNEIHFAEEKAKYGEGRILNVQGFLVHVTATTDVNDHTGCTPQLRGTNGNILPSPGVAWVALIRRGKCTFEEKVKNAWLNKASGVIVYNEENSVNLDKMKIIDKERNITAVFTYKWIGEEMGQIVDEGHSVWVSISEGQRGMKPIPNINKTSVLFVSISFIVLMVISLVWLIFYYVQRFRYLQSKDKHSRQLCSVAKRIIAKIPTKNIKVEDKDSDCCAVCIEIYKVSDCIRVLPCKHEFHKTCIDPWLLEHRTCPMCKLDVLKHYGFVFIGSQESILQLDLDMEIGDSGLHGNDDDRRLSVDNPRTSITTPTFHIQTFGGRSQLMRSSSLESLSATQREIIPARSQSSLSCVNHISDECVSDKLGSYQGTSTDMKNCAKTTDSNLLSPGAPKRNKESTSLPCTLKKLKPSDARGSNNCYVRVPGDNKHETNKGCPKSKTSCLRQASDDELLLCAEKTDPSIDPKPELSSSVQIDIDGDDEKIVQ